LQLWIKVIATITTCTLDLVTGVES